MKNRIKKQICYRETACKIAANSYCNTLLIQVVLKKPYSNIRPPSATGVNVNVHQTFILHSHLNIGYLSTEHDYQYFTNKKIWVKFTCNSFFLKTFASDSWWSTNFQYTDINWGCMLKTYFKVIINNLLVTPNLLDTLLHIKIFAQLSLIGALDGVDKKLTQQIFRSFYLQLIKNFRKASFCKIF